MHARSWVRWCGGGAGDGATREWSLQVMAVRRDSFYGFSCPFLPCSCPPRRLSAQLSPSQPSFRVPFFHVSSPPSSRPPLPSLITLAVLFVEHFI